jgi:hypothetical protein
MKRIINMGADVYPGLDPPPKMFAVWCTVSNFFHQVDGEWAWESADDLERCFNNELEELRLSALAKPALKEPELQIQAKMALRDRCVALARGSGY